MPACFWRAVVRFRLAARAASLAARTQDVAADIAEEQPLKRIAQLPNGRGERQPFDRHDVFHQSTAWAGFSLHAPELHNLRAPAHPVRNGTDEFPHANAMSGFLDDLPARAGERALVTLELAAWQHPELILRALHDSDERARAIAHHNAPGSLNRLARHSGS